MMNGTGAFIVQTVLYLTNIRGQSSRTINVTLLEDAVPNPFFRNETIACYGMYGCFSTLSPWIDKSRPVCNLPDDPVKISPNYCLLTRYNPTQCQYLDHSNRTSIYHSYFVPFHKTYVATHGFLDTGEKEWLKNIATQLLKREDANVIIINWGSGSVPPYSQAVANIRLVGRMAAVLIYALSVLTGASVSNFHLIGHSLGAHLSGYIGYTLKNNFNQTVGRITGMDPAEPHFGATQPIVRLDPSDALFVDIIHTSAKPFMAGGLGINDPIGHFDFYPNNGIDQPGCNQGMMRFIKNENESMVHGIRRFISCDHVRSHEFMAESINSDSKICISVECESWKSFLEGKCFPCKSKEVLGGVFCANFGYSAQNSWINSEYSKRKRHKHVILYAITNSEKPFCATLYRVTIQISNSTDSLTHKGEVGMFSISISGTNGSTKMTPFLKEQYFPPNSSHTYVIGGQDIGNITGANLFWEHQTTINVLTWRLDPIVYIGHVLVETFIDNKKVHLCPKYGEIMSSNSAMKMCLC